VLIVIAGVISIDYRSHLNSFEIFGEPNDAYLLL